ncbi:MAG TPA: ABC transporter permease [Reyranella sp.]|nr:ABC transporter permease [Reyranella sp.]
MAQSGLGIVCRRALIALPTLLVVSILVFTVLRLIPADPLAMSLPPNATQEEVAELRHSMGFDRSIPEQYAIWLGHIVRGDFGVSIQFRRDVLALVLEALPTTLELVAVGLTLGILLGIGCGLLMFAWRGTAKEQLADMGSIVVLSIPEFLWAILLILGLGVGVQLLPFIGRLDAQMTVPKHTGFLLIDTLVAGNGRAFLSALEHLALPSFALALAITPLIMRVLRSSLFDAYADDYITVARLRGLSERRILLGHALKNAALPTVSLIGVQAGFMFGGTLLVEVIFTLPGIGNLMVQALHNQDLPLIQGIALIYCVIVLVLNTIVEVAYLGLNPRLAQA